MTGLKQSLGSTSYACSLFAAIAVGRRDRAEGQGVLTNKATGDCCS
jgi:hypothetical protein